MNILILGNLASGKSTIAETLIKKAAGKKKNFHSIDGLRCEHSDGTLAGEFYAWAHFLDLFQHPMPQGNNIYEFSGTGKNVWWVREAMKYATKKHKAKWIVVYCLCDRAELIKRNKDRVYNVPLPFNLGSPVSSIDFMSKALKQNFGCDYWNCKEITLRTDQLTAEECADKIIGEL